jgi:hypothetical protein
MTQGGEGVMIAYMIASMIQFYYRNQNVIPICKRQVRRPRRPVTFVDHFRSTPLCYQKYLVIDNIHNRTHDRINEKEILLPCELNNVEETIALAREHHQEEQKRISEKIKKLTENWSTMPLAEREDVDDTIDSYYEYLRDLKYEITKRQDKFERELAKREGRYEEYLEELEMDWDDHNFNVGLYMT